MKKLVLFVMGLLLASTLAPGQAKRGLPGSPSGVGAPTTCPNDPVLPSDGTVPDFDFVAANSQVFYTVNVKAGHSYSIEVWDAFDPTTNPVTAPSIQVLASDCTTVIPTTNVTTSDPDLSGGFSGRVSWIQGSNAVAQIAIANPDQNNGYNYNIRVTDTTMFNARWSTAGGFNTHWGFNNTTASDISGNLTIIDGNGTVLKTVTGALIPAGRSTFYSSDSTDLNIPINHVGSAMFAYVGPPGGVLADAYFINGNASVIVPALFASKHSH